MLEKTSLLSHDDLRDYLYRNIPLSEAMGVQVALCSPQEIRLSAALAPNINHKRTAFGGSLQAIATLTCWSLLYVNLRAAAHPGEIVITNSNIDYIRPVTSDFEAIAILPEASRWEQFLRTLNRKGKAKIRLAAHILQDQEMAVDYTGSFAALCED